MQKQKLNPELSRLLTIDLETETIFGIIGRMESLTDIFHKNSEYNHLIPFLKTYKAVTQGVEDHLTLEKNFYNNPRQMEKLDVYFASLYFFPLKQYLETGSEKSPWKVYFDFCESGPNIPFVQLLLGINAHINADLYTTLLKLDYIESEDFEKVNSILSELIPGIMSYLAFEEKDIYGLGGMVLKNLYANEFKNIIVRWSTDAWYNYKKSKEQGVDHTQKIREQTEILADQIVILWQELLTKPSSTLKFLANLENLSVRL
ncbi:MAG: DUF5995 family protein [Candidatus Dojkabacteria bacterium]